MGVGSLTTWALATKLNSSSLIALLPELSCLVIGLVGFVCSDRVSESRLPGSKFGSACLVLWGRGGCLFCFLFLRQHLTIWTRLALNLDPSASQVLVCGSARAKIEGLCSYSYAFWPYTVVNCCLLFAGMVGAA